MKKALKLYLLLFCLLSDFVLFAQDGLPGTDASDGPMGADDPPPTPINKMLLLLVIFGLVYAYYKIKHYEKYKKNHFS